VVDFNNEFPVQRADTTMAEAARKSSRIWWYLGLGAVAAWCLYLAFLGPKVLVGPALLEGTGLDRPADYGWTLRDLDDAPVDFGRYRGKVVFLNIWATWCPPCVSELPSIANLAADPRLADVAFVCVSTDESAEPVRKFLRDKSWKMTVLRATELPPVFATDGIPATFVIAPDGLVVSSVIGAAKWDDPPEIAFLERLAKPAPNRP
jgi:thiol-disulfide isomerase/thioredoxin